MAEPIPIVVPHSGVVEGFLLIEWLKSTGDAVTEGDDLVTIESEKAEVVLESIPFAPALEARGRARSRHAGAGRPPRHHVTRRSVGRRPI